MKNEKGSALIAVILVVLVLTMIGLAATFYMSMEDRISQNDRLYQEALHAAEVGLKQGEQIISRTVTNTTLNTALDPASHSNYLHNDEPSSQADLVGTDHLGTVLFDSISGGNPLYNVSASGASTLGFQEQYTVYIRNNANDYNPASDSTKFYVDHDGRVNIISRGSVVLGNGQEVAVKILAEQVYFGVASVKPGQFRFGQLGTSATRY
jgi:hypothetical protein